MRDFKDFDPNCKKLKQAHCDTWGGWVYISLSQDDPGSLIDFLNPVAHELECFNSSELITVYKKSVTVKANWKTCLDAFMEVYHAPTIHKDTVNILLDGSAMAAGLLKNGHSRMVTPKKINLDGGFLGAENAALAATKIYALNDDILREKLLEYIPSVNFKKLEKLVFGLFFNDVEARLVFDPSFFGGEEIIINGLDKWVAYIKESGALFKTSQHLIGNPLISYDGELVKVRSNLNSKGYYKGEEGRSVSLWGYYETYMQRDKDSWKITKHTFFSLGADE